MRKILIIACTLIFHSFSAQVRKYSNEFLNIGVGARSLAMANANIASVSGVNAGYWNPSGLLQQKSNLDVSLMHAEYFAGIAKYDYLGASLKIDSVSAGAISLLRFGVDNIPNTLDLIDANGNIDYNRITTFNAVDFASIFSYARKIQQLKGVNIGGNFKLIRRRLGNFGGAWGFGLDLGANYEYKGFRFAAMGRDITGTYNAWSYNLSEKDIATLQSTGNEVPNSNIEVTAPKVILGAAKEYRFFKDRFSVLTEINAINTFDGKRNTVVKTNTWSMEPAIGLELGYQNLIFLRGGFGNIQKQLNPAATQFITTSQFNFGLGLNYKLFSLDYALTDIGDRSIALYSHIFSLKISIDKMKK